MLQRKSLTILFCEGGSKVDPWIEQRPLRDQGQKIRVPMSSPKLKARNLKDQRDDNDEHEEHSGQGRKIDAQLHGGQ